MLLSFYDADKARERIDRPRARKASLPMADIAITRRASLTFRLGSIRKSHDISG
jgi:hypothetical protein